MEGFSGLAFTVWGVGFVGGGFFGFRVSDLGRRVCRWKCFSGLAWGVEGLIIYV